MIKLFLRNTHTGAKFEVISFDKATGTIKLKGEHAPFEEKFDKAQFKALGYEQTKEEVPDEAPAEEIAGDE